MNKKKIISLLAITALLFTATSCQQEEDPTMGKAKVTFIAELPELPEHLDSRAIGDGDYANELFFWVYDEAGHEIQGLRQRNIDFQGSLAYTQGRGRRMCRIVSFSTRIATISSPPANVWSDRS